MADEKKFRSGSPEVVNLPGNPSGVRDDGRTEIHYDDETVKEGVAKVSRVLSDKQWISGMAHNDQGSNTTFETLMVRASSPPREINLNDAECEVVEAIRKLWKDGNEWPTNKQIFNACDLISSPQTVKEITGYLCRCGIINRRATGHGYKVPTWVVTD